MPVASLQVSAVAPRETLNTAPTRLVVQGANFTPDLAVLVGAQRLAEVTVSSSSELVASLPAGVCPGTYPVGILDPAGGRVDAGEIVVRAERAASLGAVPPGAPARLTGGRQTLSVPLPEIQVEDSGCATDDWLLHISLGQLVVAGRPEQPLALRTLRLHGPGIGQPIQVALDRDAGEITVRVPRPAGPQALTLRAELEVEVPANAYAGAYRMTVDVALADPS